MPGGRKVSLRRRRRQRGGEIVEGATTFLVFFVMVFGLIDFSRMVWAYHQIAFGAREATRYAIVHGSPSGNHAAPSRISGIGPDPVLWASPNNLTTTLRYNPSHGPGRPVKAASA